MQDGARCVFVTGPTGAHKSRENLSPHKFSVARYNSSEAMSASNLCFSCVPTLADRATHFLMVLFLHFFSIEPRD